MGLGWGDAWGDMPWGGSEGSVFTYEGNIGLSFSPSYRSKRSFTKIADLALSLLPTSDHARGMRSNVIARLLPSYSGITSDYVVNENSVGPVFTPDYALAVAVAISGPALTLLPDHIVIPIADVGVEFLLIPSAAEIQQSIVVNSDLRLALTPGHTSIIPDYVINEANIDLIFVPDSTVYGWACPGRGGSVTFTEQSRPSDSWASVARPSTSFTEVSR